jgi:hypothetical protein
MGFRKVAGLLDGDKTKELALLKKAFPDFYFDCIPAKDIRTKPARPSTDKIDGLLDINMTVRPELSGTTKIKLASLFSHLN